VSCGNQEQSEKNNGADSGLITAATGLGLTRYDGYTEVIIRNPWQGAKSVVMKYALVKDGSAAPVGFNPENIINVPVQRIICMSTTHAGMISALGEEGTIKGMSGTEFIFSPSVSELINKGAIKEVGYETNLNQEIVVKISPDLVMMYGIGSESASHINKMKELGLKVMFNGDYLETDPLAKAEWIKLFGALYCREEMADSIFKSVSDDYNNIRSYVNSGSSARPTVLLGLPFKDTWFISPGNSFVSKLIEDAGGNYLWHNTISEYSLPYGLENVYTNALNADYWLNIGTVKSTSEITMIDPRLKDLKSFRDGNLFNNNKRLNSNGGNDYWESGAVRPNLILRDIAVILHPELFPGMSMYYYQKIE
jgi:iron complex transport system substrate-binding protein